MFNAQYLFLLDFNYQMKIIHITEKLNEILSMLLIYFVTEDRRKYYTNIRKNS